jgi:hypothetical protein
MPSASAAAKGRAGKPRGLLRVQVHIRVPKGPEYTKMFLDSVAARWMHGEELPPRVKVFALEWSNNGGRSSHVERNPHKMKLARESFSRIPGLFPGGFGEEDEF